MGAPDNPQTQTGHDHQRLTRLEEHAGFTERAVDELSAEVRLLNQRLHDMSRRLDALEGKLGGVVERMDKAEDPAE